MAERLSLKERLSRLEAELDELISLQESKRGRVLEDVIEPSAHQYHQRAISVTTRSRAMISNHRCCVHDPATSAPLTDISKFLQHINQNISKGTQAIAKLATSAALDTGEKHTNCLAKRDHHDGPNVWRPPTEKKNNEDGLYKELREEKDKRSRAENQIKSLKDELKKTRSELEQKADSAVHMLQEELKDTLEKLNRAESELQRRSEEFKSAEYLWPLKYQTMSRELMDENQKRKEAEETVRKLQDTLQKMFLDMEEHLTLQRTAKWIQKQNENLLCLAENLKRETETKNAEISKKNRCIEDNFKRIKQLTVLCGKLRDFLIVAKDKVATTEERLKQTMDHSQRLSEKMLQAQRQVEDLQGCREGNKKEITRLTDLLRCSEIKNNSLHSRLDEISDMMKKQNEIITRQSDTINNKDEQLKLAYENIKLQSQRLADLENKLSSAQNCKELQRNSLLHAELNRLQVDLENEKENIKIKDKIIDSNLKTISENKNELMRKEADINKLRRDLSEAERKLSIEKTTNEELHLKMKQLQMRKDELKRRVEELEEETLQSSEYVKKLEEIEKQVQLKQKEWEESKVKLVKQREEAIETQKRLSQQLAEQTSDSEKELENMQRMIGSLNLQIQEKETQLQEAKSECKRLTTQLHEADEQGKNMRRRFEENLQHACEVWHKTMLQLNI